MLRLISRDKLVHVLAIFERKYNQQIFYTWLSNRLFTASHKYVRWVHGRKEDGMDWDELISCTYSKCVKFCMSYRYLSFCDTTHFILWMTTKLDFGRDKRNHQQTRLSTKISVYEAISSEWPTTEMNIEGMDILSCTRVWKSSFKIVLRGTFTRQNTIAYIYRHISQKDKQTL